MQLIDFPDEILLKIIADVTILSVTDLLSISLCGRRLGYLVLPQLYSSICLIDNPTRLNLLNRRLQDLNTILTTSPERRSWLNTASISWTGENVENGAPWLTQAKMFGILTQLPSLRSLGIGERIQRSFGPFAVLPVGPSKLLRRYASSFRYLRRLILDDFMTTTADIAAFFTWPNLHHLTISNLIVLYSEETVFSAKKSLAVPKSNVQSLEFRRCQHNPFGPLLENLLKNQSQLRHLAVETTGHFRTPATVQNCLNPLRDNLVELELTTLSQPEIVRAGIPHNDGSILDLSQFQVLRKMEIEDHLLFPWPVEYTPSTRGWSSPHIADTGLAARLPESLECLIVSPHLFDSQIGRK